MLKIRTLNNISVEGLRRFPRDRYEVGSDVNDPDAIMLRSYDMHQMDIPATVAAVGRAGAGTNNIPVDALSARGVPVFNAPGANANAVKELTIAALLIGVRNLADGWSYVRGLKGNDEELGAAVEAGKKQFVGVELPGKRIGVVGLGAIGVEVANAALELGMKVVGFDPQMTVRNAWQLSAGVELAETLDELFQRSDVITCHVPLVDGTRGLVNRDRIALMNKGGVVINFARGGIVDDAAVMSALDDGKLHAYISDFPTRELIEHPKVVAFPHLGASTVEAEQNCAVMVADNLREFLENGNIRYSVNFPQCRIPRMDAFRLTIANANVPNMVGQISTCLGAAGLNIEDLLNKSIGDLAYTIVDVNGPVSPQCEADIRAIDGVLAVRNIGKPT